MAVRTALLAHISFCGVWKANSVVRASLSAAAAHTGVDRSICNCTGHAHTVHTPCTHRAHTVHTHTHHIMTVSSLASGQDRCAHTFGVEQSGRRAVVGSAFGHASQRAVHSARFVIWHRRALWACLCRTASRARVYSAAESALTVVSAEARLLRLRTVLDEGVCLSRRGLEQREQQSPQQRHRDSPAHQPPCPFSLLSLCLSLSRSLLLPARTLGRK